MNRRGFISSILMACVAPKVLIPKDKDHFNWRIRKRRGLFIAEFQYAISPPPRDLMEGMVLLMTIPEKFEIRPDERIPREGHDLVFNGPDKHSVFVEYKVNPYGTITFGSVVGANASESST